MLIDNKVIKSGIWFTMSNFLVRGIGFISTPIFTRLMSQEEFGDYSNFTTWASILLIIVSLNLEASFIRARFDFEDDLDTYVLSMLALSMLLTAIWWVLAHIFKNFFTRFLSMNEIYINCMFLYLAFYPAINIFQNIERFRYKYKWTVFISLLVTILTSLISVLLVVKLQDHLLGRVIGYVVPIAFIGAIICIFYIIKAKKIRIKYWKYALPFTLPFVPHLLSMTLLGSLDRVMIKKMCGASDVALYSLAYTCGTLISMLMYAINNAFSPWLGEKLSRKDYQAIKKISVPYVEIFAYFACVAVLLTPEVLLILGGRLYMKAVYVMPPVAAGCVLQYIYCMYVNVEQYEKKTIGMAIASVLSALLNCILNYIFIDLFGFIAAAYTTYASYLFLLVMHMLLVRYIGYWHVYDNRKIIATVGVASTLIICSSFVMEHVIIRYCFVIAIVLIGLCIAKKKNINIKDLI